MSQHLITIDDHSGVEIVPDQTAQTRARIVLAREGTGEVIEWTSLNLTDESWDLLVKTVREFCPDVEPDMTGEAHAAYMTSNERIRAMESAADAEAQALAAADAAATAQAAELAAADTEQTQTVAPKVPAPKAASVPLSQGEQRKQSAAVRAWWHGLSPQALRALGLPEPKSGPGKMPVAVTDAYAQAHA